MPNDPQTAPLIATMTGELFQPCRLYYAVSNIQAVKAVFGRMKCMDYDETAQRWVWLYDDEARSLKFKNSYRDIEVHLRPVVLGAFFRVNDQHIHLDVRSGERLVHAIQFFDKWIPRRAAMATHVAMYNLLSRGDPTTPQNQFDDLFAAIPAPSSQFEEDVARISQIEPDQEKRLALITELMDKRARGPYPITETLPLHFYEDGILQLRNTLSMRHIVAVQHDLGNTDYRVTDLIHESLGIEPKVARQSTDRSTTGSAALHTSQQELDLDYPDPVSKLLTLGKVEASEPEQWLDYQKLGLTVDHATLLIHMATDQELNQADSESLLIWAPLHAWRALGQLGVDDVVQPLFQLLTAQEDEFDDWLMDELPLVCGMIGHSAIVPMVEVLDMDVPSACRNLVPTALGEIGKRHPGYRAECIQVLTRQLEQHQTNDPEFNAFLIQGLEQLRAVESLEQIRQAYDRKCVDVNIMGDLEDVEILFGVREKRTTPRPRYTLFANALRHQGSLLVAESVVRAPKIGRNDPCPCGSGQKYKKCCLN
ncbi:MAG: SEC-C metal-binding domain-containing protein [Magnetococcus sp. YQC-9]